MWCQGYKKLTGPADEKSNNIASVYPLTKAGGFLGEATAVEPDIVSYFV